MHVNCTSTCRTHCRGYDVRPTSAGRNILYRQLFTSGPWTCNHSSVPVPVRMPSATALVLLQQHTVYLQGLLAFILAPNIAAPAVRGCRRSLVRRSRNIKAIEWATRRRRLYRINAALGELVTSALTPDDHCLTCLTPTSTEQGPVSMRYREAGSCATYTTVPSS